MIVDPPGEPSARSGAPSARTIVGAIELRGRLPGAGQVRVVAALGVGEVEVGQLVVEQEAAARHDDAVAAERLDGERVRHHVAPAVGGGQVRRGLAVGALGADRRRLGHDA